MLLRLTTLLALLVTSLGASADSIDFNLYDKALRLTYATGLSGNMKGMDMDAGVLYHENGDNAYHVGMNVTGENWSDAGTFDISLGARTLFVPGKHIDALAIGIGGRVRFSPVHRLGIGGHIYYAPDILSFIDASTYREYGVRLDYQLLPQAFVYVGYRKMELDLNTAGTATAVLDDKSHIGMKLLF